MKYLRRFNENLEFIPDVIKNLEQMLYSIKDVGFKTKVDFLDENFLVVDISMDSTEFVVFNSIDIRETLEDINRYLTLDEKFNLIDVELTTVPFSIKKMKIDRLLKTSILLVRCKLTWGVSPVMT